MVFTSDQYRDIFLIWDRQTEGAQKKVADTGGDASFDGGVWEALLEPVSG